MIGNYFPLLFVSFNVIVIVRNAILVRFDCLHG
jgi:hypothetical protein